MLHCFKATICLLAIFFALPNAAKAEETFEPNWLDSWSALLLSQARTGLADFYAADSRMDMDTSYATAMTALTALAQLYGSEWALEELDELRQSADGPELFFGYSADGRMALRIDRMELKSPEFEPYRFYLVNIVSNTGATVSDEGRSLANMRVVTDSGDEFEAEDVAPEHPLWPKLSMQAERFELPDLLYPGSSATFRQIFVLSDFSAAEIAEFRLDWAGYSLIIPAK